MNLLLALTFCLAIARSAMARVSYGLLVCEQGPVIFRQTTTNGVSFQIEPPSQSSCTPGNVVCNADLGFFTPQHSGIGMCAVSRNCAGGQQVCLRRFQGGQNSVVGCCKEGFEAWALSGTQETSGSQNPPQL